MEERVCKYHNSMPRAEFCHYLDSVSTFIFVNFITHFLTKLSILVLVLTCGSSKKQMLKVEKSQSHIVTPFGQIQ